MLMAGAPGLAAAGTLVSETSTPPTRPLKIANPDGEEGVISICTPAYPICSGSDVEVAADALASYVTEWLTRSPQQLLDGMVIEGSRAVW